MPITDNFINKIGPCLPSIKCYLTTNWSHDNILRWPASGMDSGMRAEVTGNYYFVIFSSTKSCQTILFSTNTISMQSKTLAKDRVHRATVAVGKQKVKVDNVSFQWSVLVHQAALVAWSFLPLFVPRYAAKSNIKSYNTFYRTWALWLNIHTSFSINKVHRFLTEI